MKPKGFNKKLVFKKQTISNLENKQLDDVQGGLPPSYLTLCPDCTGFCTQISACICPTDEEWKTCCGSNINCTC